MKLPSDDDALDDDVSVLSDAAVRDEERAGLLTPRPNSRRSNQSSKRSFSLQVQPIVVPKDPWASIRNARNRRRRCRICVGVIITMALLAVAAFIVTEMAEEEEPLAGDTAPALRPSDHPPSSSVDASTPAAGSAAKQVGVAGGTGEQSGKTHESINKDVVGTDLPRRTDYTVPAKDGKWWYYQRTYDDRMHAVHCRAPLAEGSDTDPLRVGKVVHPTISWDYAASGAKEMEILPNEQVYLDENVLAEGKEYFAIGSVTPSPSHNLVAYTVDYTGDGTFELHIKNMQSAQEKEKEEEFDDEGQSGNVGAAIVWGADDTTIYYVRLDNKRRPYQVRKRTQSMGSTRQDVMLYEELDENYRVSVAKSADGKYLFIRVSSDATSEVHYLDLTAPEPELECIADRREKVLYEVEHRDGEWLITTNYSGRTGKDGSNIPTTNMRLMRCRAIPDSAGHWLDMRDGLYKVMFDGSEQRTLYQVQPFWRHAVVAGKEDGLARVWVIRFGEEECNLDIIDFTRLDFTEPTYDVRLSTNRDYAATEILLKFELRNANSPSQIVLIDMDDPDDIGSRQVLKNSRSEDKEGTNALTPALGAIPQFQCPVKPSLPAENDKPGNFDEYIEDDAAKLSNATTFFSEFRSKGYDGFRESFQDAKANVYDYVVNYFVPPLRNGGTIYESACGMAANLLMTLEILAENYVADVEVYGNDYVNASVDLANQLLSQTLPAGMHLGKICQADSTNLSHVPSDSFDVVFTGYIDPIIDPLNLAAADDDIHSGWELSKKRCRSTNETDVVLARKEQAEQERWFARWVTEMVRIAKHGGVIVIEEVARPLCELPRDWGGVSQDWWADAVSTYNWDINVSSIRFDSAPRNPDYDGIRYNVAMKKTGVAK